MLAARTLLLAMAVTVGCGDDDGDGRGAQGGEAPPRAERSAAYSRGELLREADARRLSERLREALSASDPGVRRTAVLAVARLHDPAAAPALVQALRDPDPEVRRNASLGLGGFEEDAPGGVADALLGALAAERDPANRPAMLRDLARVAGDEGLPAFREGMGANEPEVRAAACEGLGSYGLRGRPLPPALLRRIAARMVDDGDPRVRLACSYALTRLAPPLDAPEEAEAIVADLSRAADDEDPEVRAMAVRALGRFPGAPVDRLVGRSGDPDWRVAVQAFRALGRLGDPARGAFARALRARLDRALSDGVEPTGPELHVLLAAFEAGAPFARGKAVHEVATSALARIEDLEGPATRDRGLAHCGAAGLVDRGRGWPTRLMQCGLGQVPEPERQVAMAEVLRSVEGAERERLALLERLYREGGARVREAVLAAATALPAESVGPLVLRGLRSGDPGVIAAALEAVALLAPRWRAEAEAPPVSSVRPAGTPMPAPEAAGGSGPSAAQLGAALTEAWGVLQAGDEVEGLQSWARAVGALDRRDMAERVGSLALHPVRAVRRTARQVLAALEAEPPEGEVAPVPNPIAAEEVPAPDRPARAVLRTSRGEIEIDLLVREAPTTVARFVSLAREGFYDGLTFHRVVPAFVIQGGDPRGDGYGGPGWTQRCEDNRVPYRRGTVGMALAGRDTGGSQFFIAHSAQPHLNGRYTAFGQVVRGLDVVDRIQVGDRIEGIDVTADDAE